MANYKEKGIFSYTVKVLQIIFFVVIGFCAVYGLYLNKKQNDLIFQPVVGITSADITIHLKTPNNLTFENVLGASIKFNIENVGNLPAKDFTIKTIGKLGDIIMPRKETDEEKRGVVILPRTKVTNTSKIGKKVLEELIESKNRLIYTVEIFYTDWENYKKYCFSQSVEIYMESSKPLKFGARLVPE